MEAIGILPAYQGRAIPARVSSDDHDAWAQDRHDLVLSMSHTSARFRATGAYRLPHTERDALVLRLCEILQQGLAAQQIQAPPSAVPLPTQPGRRTQADANNLLNALLARAEQVLAFLDDLTVPFRKNQAERDLRRINVQHKIAETFRHTRSGHGFLHHAQRSFHDEKTRPLHARRHDSCL